MTGDGTIAGPPAAQAPAPPPSERMAPPPKKSKGPLIAVVVIIVIVVVLLLVYFMFLGGGNGGPTEFTAAEWNTEASGTVLGIGDFATLNGGDSAIVRGTITNTTILGVELDNVELNFFHDFSSYNIGDTIAISFDIDEALGIETIVSISVSVT